VHLPHQAHLKHCPSGSGGAEEKTVQAAAFAGSPTVSMDITTGVTAPLPAAIEQSTIELMTDLGFTRPLTDHGNADEDPSGAGGVPAWFGDLCAAADAGRAPSPPPPTGGVPEQVNKWGFAPGVDDTTDLNMELKGALPSRQRTTTEMRILCMATK
jgi:hypothetical protein